jgi:hypothetical protein
MTKGGSLVVQVVDKATLLSGPVLARSDRGDGALS